MSTYGTKFTETEVLLAVQSGDREHAAELLAGMSTTESPDLAAAVAGPWQAVVADKYGRLINLNGFTFREILDDPTGEPARITVVRGTARSVNNCLPRSYLTLDVLYTVDDLDCLEVDEVLIAWSRAQAVAIALNAWGNLVGTS